MAIFSDSRGGVLLNTYTGFWIKKPVAYHYFHKSEILYRFIKNYQQNKSRKDLIMQYHYITKKFSKSTLTSHLKDQNLKINTSGNQLDILNNNYSLSLQIHEKQLDFCCETLHDAEKFLFPALRSFHPFIFIIDTNMDNFGWISPITMNREHKKEQVLYSFL
ncbi:sporulation inhibitor of replication protein SirA [Virgibacillus alimentarius]|uniref:sporulation inhibitor of replication protein SirA n=1 Tax=Virgibacillus alimentarius TaxID=698769 RepID=UPI00362E54F7